MTVSRMFAGGLQIFRQPLEKSFIAAQMRLKPVGVLILTMATTRVVSWSMSESLRHINYFELLAVKFALSSLFDNRSNIHVRVMSDKTTTVSYISSMGGCKSTECNSITKDIWDWARERNISLSAAPYIPECNNVDVDLGIKLES